MFDLARALAAQTPVECTLRGTVLDAPHYFYGNRTHAVHEAFHVMAEGVQLEVLENLTLASKIPVQIGDEIELRGELVPLGSHGPLLHWIHHSTNAHHAGGYCIDHGIRYD